MNNQKMGGEDDPLNSFARASHEDGGHAAHVSRRISNKAWYAVAFAATISSMTAATLGYDVGIMAAAIDFISDTMNLDHGQTQVGLILVLLCYLCSILLGSITNIYILLLAACLIYIYIYSWLWVR
jgi:hypothetical protein